MASIKVSYGQTSRKFTIPSNTTWTEFESILHDLFNIPNENTISLSYIDEDEDVITLSTDSELQQILSDQELFGTNVKFNVYTSENPDNDGWVLENAEEKDASVTTLSDDDSTLNKDEVIAYNIGEPSETENQVIKQIANIQLEERQPAVDYPHVMVTDEKDDPLFEPTAQREKDSEKQQEELLIPVNSEKEQNQETPNNNENSSSTNEEAIKENTENEKYSSTSSDEEAKKDDDENDSNIIFIISSSPWVQRTYYRPRVSSFAGLLNGYSTHFGNFIKPRYSYITPSCGFRRHPYFGCESTSRYRRFGLFI